ncbi:serine hydrolase domain-containing protein [Saccharopolyspora sp. NPDC000359]|uniref:serine hydrolase domain-containing protein n=1 Tax=Saccharopolyspora sp. NPDC000359 TaxID=3154251 RepID=UPI00331D12A6
MRFVEARLARLRQVLSRYVDSGALPGVVAAVSRGGETHVEVIGAQSFDGPPMRRDSIFRIASMTKPITAAAALVLVEECALRLDDPVDPLLPELADRRVLTRLDGPLTETVPAHRPITPRDLLTFRFGLGYVPGEPPIFQAMAEAGLAPGPGNPALPVAEWMRRLGELPLAHQPGEQWLYHTGSDVLGVLIARAADQPFPEFLRERIFEPLGMRDTGFHVPADQAHRVAASYLAGPTGEPVLRDDPRTAPPAFPAGGSGLVSTADDYLAFYRMLLNGGRVGADRILSRAAVELMRTDHLTEQQKRRAGPVLDEGMGWAFGHAVITDRAGMPTPGTQTWSGGLGTTAFADPAEDLAGVLLTQRAMDSRTNPAYLQDFTTTTYQSLT